MESRLLAENWLSPGNESIRTGKASAHIEFGACEFINRIQRLIHLKEFAAFADELGAIELRIGPWERPAEIAGMVAQADFDRRVADLISG